jgi:5-methylcytosine-specific restriction protein B
VVPLDDNISELLQGALQDSPTDLIGEPITSAPARKIIEQDIPQKIEEILNDEDLMIESSVGQGTFTAIPWVAIMDPEETSDIQSGIYIVYLFEPQKGRVRLTLNQGVTEPKNKMGNSKAREYLKETADSIRDEIKLENFETGDLDFPNSSHRNNLYGPATIYYREYELESMPSSDEIREDLIELTGAYKNFVSSKKAGQSMNIGTQTTDIGSLACDTTVLEIALKEYESFRETEDYQENYKWELLEELNSWYQKKHIDSETVEDFVEILRDKNPSSGSLVDWRELDDLSEFVQTDPEQASHHLSQLFNEESNLEKRIKSFRKTIPVGSAGVGLLLAVSNPNRFAPFRDTNFTRFVEMFSDHAEEYLDSLSVAKKYRMYMDVLNDLVDMVQPSSDVQYPILYAQDFLYTVTSYNEPRFNTILKRLQSFAKDLERLKGDTPALLEIIGSLDSSLLENQAEQYEGDKKVNWIRYKVIERLLQGDQVDLENLKSEANERFEKDILRSWTDFKILMQIPLNHINNRTERYVEWLAEALRDEIGSEDLDTHFNNFQGAQNFPRSTVWASVFPTEHGDHRRAYQYGINIRPNKTRFGIWKGDQVENPTFDSDQERTVLEKEVPSITAIMDDARQRTDRLYELNNSVNLIGENREEEIKKLPIFDSLRRQLEKEKQVILYGPTGTGKTYAASRFAQWWVQEGGGDLDEQIDQVTFHPSFSYEDFMEGLTARTEDQDVVYEMKEGRLKEFAEEARAAYLNSNGSDPAPRFILVIDEINRGNLPQIFGETITLLESSKRLEEPNQFSVNLSHSGESFTLPPNLYIIGTMNTADHSIALLDTAIRRRFRFLALNPDYEKLREEFGIEPDDVANQAVNATDNETRLQALTLLGLKHINSAIRDVGNLGPGKQIGHAWFIEAETEEQLLDVWRYEVLPLLEEYYFGKLKLIKREIFDGNGDNLYNWEEGRIRDFSSSDLINELESLASIEVQ